MAMILSALYHDDSSRIFWVKALRKLWWRCPKTKPSSSEFRSNPRGVQSYSKFQLPLVISSRDHQVWKCLTCPKQASGIPLLPCSYLFSPVHLIILITLDFTWLHLIVSGFACPTLPCLLILLFREGQTPIEIEAIPGTWAQRHHENHFPPKPGRWSDVVGDS